MAPDYLVWCIFL